MAALFLPPMDDGASVRYVISRGPAHPALHGPQDNRGSFSMPDVLQRLFPNSDAKGRAIDLYRSRATAALGVHVGSPAYADVEGPRQVPNFRGSLDHLEQQQAALMSIAGDIDQQIARLRTWVQRSEDTADAES